MIVDLLTLLTDYGHSTVSKIQQNLQSTGTNATNKTSQSVNFEIERTGEKIKFRLVGRPYIMSVETGRGPKKSGSGGQSNMVQNLLEWMDARNIKTDLDQKKRMGFAKFLARHINEKGTKLYRSGGRKDIITPVLDGLSDRISLDILQQFSKMYLTKVVGAFKK
jgi:hypothetical protein